MADKPSPDASSISSEFHSERVESLRVAMETLDVNDEQAKAKVEIKFSEVHWSEPARFYDATETLDSSSTPLYDAAETVDSSSTPHKWLSKAGTLEWDLEVAKDNELVFRMFQKIYPMVNCIDENDLGPDSTEQLPMWVREADFNLQEIVLSSETPFAEGGQADLFHVRFLYSHGQTGESTAVMKVFKKGMPLRELYNSLSTNILADDMSRKHGRRRYVFRRFAGIACVLLLKSSRRFAFLMDRAWGDLRKLIEVRLVHFKSSSQPFPDDVAFEIISQIASGMGQLHDRNNIHRDLKASNVLVFGPVNILTPSLGWHDLDPKDLGDDFECQVADYECAAGTVGTGFWRAPEILEAYKIGSVPRELFTKQVDVYSFGMTCYEILSGHMPFEDLEPWDYGRVIGGERPTLPSRTRRWMVELVERCWHKDPSKRPPFEEIVRILNGKRKKEKM